MTIVVEDLKLLDVYRASEDIRKADQDECYVGTGMGVPSYMSTVWHLLEHKRVAKDEGGELLCAWGVDSSGAAGVGNVWLFATNRAVPRARAIHRYLKVEFQAILSLYPVLTCWADSRNTKHHEWLRWLGFEEVGEHPYGFLEMPFKNFVRKG